MAARFRQALVLTAVAGLFGAFAEEPGKPHFIVSTFSLGVSGGTMEAAEFARALSADGWCVAVPEPRAQHWNRRPAALPAESWISVVLAGFGEQAEAFAFMHDGPGGGLRLVAHVPYRMAWSWQAATKVWWPPTARLAGAFRAACRPHASSQARPERVHVKAMEWGGLAGAGDSSKPAKAEAGLGDTIAAADAAPTVAVSEALPPLEAMLCAALCENGWSPTWSDTDPTLALEVRFGFRVGSFRITEGTGDGPVARRKNDIPEEHYYGFLRRMLGQSRQSGPGTDFAWLGPTPARALLATPDRLCALNGSDLVAYDPRNGRSAWPEKTPPRAPPRCTVRPSADGDAVVYLLAKGISAVDIKDGTTQELAAESPTQPWSLAGHKDGTIVVASASTLAASRNGSRIWSRDDLRGTTAGPVLARDRVIVGMGSGSMVCLALENGQNVWRAVMADAWQGEILCLEDRFLAFSSRDESLVAMSTADGSVLWKRPVGDVLLRAPIAVNGRVLVVGKNNRILLLDAAHGTPVADITWPTWLVDVQVVPGAAPRVACTDIARRFTELDATVLKPIRELTLPSRPAGTILFVPRFPLLWAAGDTEGKDMEDLFSGEAGPVLLVSDEDGFCAIIPEKQE